MSFMNPKLCDDLLSMMYHLKMHNLLPKQQNFDLNQIESICRRQFTVARMMISILDRAENIVGKGENAGYQHFLLFPQFFRKFFFSKSL